MRNVYVWAAISPAHLKALDFGKRMFHLVRAAMNKHFSHYVEHLDNFEKINSISKYSFGITIFKKVFLI